MVRVATYNIRKCVGLDWRRRPERVVEVLSEVKPQVVALQEADRRFGDRRGTLPVEHLAGASGLRVVFPADSGGSHGFHGNAILVGGDVEVRKVDRLVLPCLEPRGALVADLHVAGVHMRVVAVHFGLHAASRAAQADTVLAMLKQRQDGAAEVVLGDFNQWRDEGGSIGILSERLKPAPARPSFHTSRPVAPVDRILVGPDLRIAAHGVHVSALARRASDHLPVWADLVPAQT
jgi:endonuclease/exonuclease/phosphatase family metal-dependent hydrolase